MLDVKHTTKNLMKFAVNLPASLTFLLTAKIPNLMTLLKPEKLDARLANLPVCNREGLVPKSLTF